MMKDNGCEVCLTMPATSVLNILVNVLRQAECEDYYVYERPPCWYLALGRRVSLTVESSGQWAVIETATGKQRFPVEGPLAAYARRFIREHGVNAPRVYGEVGFHYASQVRHQSFTPGQWPLLSLMVPCNELVFDDNKVRVLAESESACRRLCDWLHSALSVIEPHSEPDALGYCAVNDSDDDDTAYCYGVNLALEEIMAGRYTKVILSRVLDLPHVVDMPATLLRGRQVNTPTRSFLLRQGEREAVGFCPELVMQTEQGKVVTHPLAGTRSRPENTPVDQQAQGDFLQNCKEVVEHVITVKAAVDELNTVCQPGTVVIDDLMSVRERGSVQHLGSQVSGQLAPDKDDWDAFDVLFPAITASGVPKSAALDAIQRLESVPRELYSGAILWIEGQHRFEAALVLRSAFQDKQRCWVQAGAGIIAQSLPVRELTETREKLASIMPHLIVKHKKR